MELNLHWNQRHLVFQINIVRQCVAIFAQIELKCKKWDIFALRKTVQKQCSVRFSKSGKMPSWYTASSVMKAKKHVLLQFFQVISNISGKFQGIHSDLRQIGIFFCVIFLVGLNAPWAEQRKKSSSLQARSVRKRRTPCGSYVSKMFCIMIKYMHTKSMVSVCFFIQNIVIIWAYIESIWMYLDLFTVWWISTQLDLMIMKPVHADAVNEFDERLHTHRLLQHKFRGSR